MATQLRFAVTGATGLVGRRLGRLLTEQGHVAWGLTRGGTGATSDSSHAIWNVESGEIRTPGPADVVVHLAGRNVAVRWSEKVKREIWESRVTATEKLCAFLARQPAEQRPRVLIAASAVGIYGSRGDEVLTENSSIAEPGRWFLADVCRAWEAATGRAADVGIRVVHVRIGVVLDRASGALAKMAGPVKWGLGGPVGPGTQWMPWISNTDLCRLLLAAALDDQTRGILHGTTATPVRQHAFMRALGHVLHRPTIFPLPSMLVKLAFGQMGQEVLLSSSRVVATKVPAGFTLMHPTLEEALHGELVDKAV